jgi:hypothetical protein
MTMLEDHVQFVNEQIVFQEKTIENLSASPGKQKFHNALKQKFEALRDYLIEQGNVSTREAPRLSTKTVRLSLTPNDLEGLPEELVKELSISDGDRTEFTLLNILEEFGGIASLDQLLIGLYKKTGEVLKRQALTSRLYRMSQKELIWGVPTKKGVYSNRQITEAEAAKIFGGESQES